ncbi:DUF3579 domain-containing protein [uncultured Castellaniella sp.]|uniref:DUF3579 domain-containing protein n=1 Tax=uncultured Castellaniella sp. TaxID=647907 RepID=UPI002607B2DF|nr:DUF3579 domain-containing protein [uncultured Castellaniella sp.]
MNHPVQHLIIHGKTLDGQRFRPSDWAERLAGVLSQFRPAGSIHNPLSYSPYAMPRSIDGTPCVVIDQRLRQLEPLAWKFACDFADSNHLQTTGIADPIEDAPDA